MSENQTIDLPDYPHFVESLRAELRDLAEECDSFTGIDHVLDWMQRTGRRPAPVDIVGQDEFNYDFLVELEPNGSWIAFGVT